MRKLFILLAFMATAAFTTVNAQDTCNCPVTKKHHVAIKRTPVKDLNVNITNEVPATQAPDVNVTVNNQLPEDNNNGSALTWFLIAIGVIGIGGLIYALVSNRRPRAIHEFISNQSIREVANNGGYLTHTSPKGEKLVFSVNKPTVVTENLRRVNEAEAPAQ